MKSPIKAPDRTPSTRSDGQPEITVGSIQFSPVKPGTLSIDEWVNSEAKMQRAAAYEDLVNRLFDLYGETFPGHTWVGPKEALDKLVFEISSLRWEIKRLNAEARPPDSRRGGHHLEA